MPVILLCVDVAHFGRLASMRHEGINQLCPRRARDARLTSWQLNIRRMLLLWAIYPGAIPRLCNPSSFRTICSCHSTAVRGLSGLLALDLRYRPLQCLKFLAIYYYN